MKLLNNNIAFWDWSGYFVAKKYFKGKFRRQIWLTVYDLKLNTSTWGYLFICQENVILLLRSGLSDGIGVYKIEVGDTLSIIQDGPDLKRIVNSDKSGEKSFYVKTTNPICYVNVNDSYLWLMSIQVSKKYGYLIKGVASRVYLVKKDYQSRVENVITVIKKVLNKDSHIDFDLPMKGETAWVSLFNIYVGLLVYATFIIGFVLLFVLKILRVAI